MIWRIIATGGALSFLATGFSVLSDPNCITADIGGGRVVGVTCRVDSYGTWSGSVAGMIMCFLGIALLGLIYWRYIITLISRQRQTVYRNPSESTRPGVRFNLSKVPSKSTFKDENISTLKVCSECSTKVPVDWSLCDRCLSTRFHNIEEKDLILTENLTQIKICDNCKSEVPVFYPKCFECDGTTFTHKQVKRLKQSSSVSSKEAMLAAVQESRVEPTKVSNPEFKTCSMCAEEIKFAAKKCRYCQHMMDA